MTTPARTLRPWQHAALGAWQESGRADFLAVATPGAGKTTFALAAARRAFADGRIDQLVIVCPSDHLRRQWADAAADAGLPVDPEFSNADAVTSPQFCGIAVTYAQIASAPAVHRAGAASARTMVILDEVHHAGDDKSWGDGLREAYAGATLRLSLSGTPWRSDTSPIPFVSYAPDSDGSLRSASDYRYGYAQALADQVVRPVMFLAYSGMSRWRDSAGAELEAHLDDPMTNSAMRQAWRTALDPKGDWIAAVLRAADARLSSQREQMPDAGGLVLASNRNHARAYARQLEQISGEAVTVVTSDDPTASDRIEAFARGRSRWIVAVRMVSEGVDLPRAATLVYATNAATPLFFAQAVGRVVRSRAPAESATVFVPSVPPLLALAAALEAERDHVLSVSTPAGDGLLDDALLEAANRTANNAALGGEFTALEASGHLDRVIYGGAEHGTMAATGSAAETSWLTLPGLLDAAELGASVKARAATQLGAAAGAWSAGAADVPLHRKVSAARRELHKLVNGVHHRTGAGHAEIQARLRNTTGGPPAAAATLEQLEARISVANGWL